MCGIHATISKTTPPLLSPYLRACLANRGPDHIGQLAARIYGTEDADATFLTLTSTVLALRGDHLTKQPLIHPQTGSALCWNGEAWKIDGLPVEGNDAQAILDLLFEASASAAGDVQAVLDVLLSIQGPFAFVYFNKPARKVYYGRDRLGRRSLLALHSQDGSSLALSSIADAFDSGWEEVDADGVYVLDLAPEVAGTAAVSLLSPTRHLYKRMANAPEDFVLSIGRFNMDLLSDDTLLLPSSAPVEMLKEQLLNALRLRVLNVPDTPTTSGTATISPGTRIAILFSGGLDCTVLARLCHDLLPEAYAVDLLNVAFENPRVASQLQKQANGAVTDVYEACPDRMTGRKAFAELQKVCPGRAFRFISVNVPYTETCSHRADVVSLMHPHNTEMDLSIAYALYFAARGEGLCVEQADSTMPPVPYRTPARVLLSGLGADELFGGYVRHATAFSRRGYAGLVDELKLDVSRLSKRNLGRDDRVMAHWGKEVRFPYLDEELVKWAMERPAWEKCDFDNGEEISGVEPGKRILRLLALELGLEQVSREKKRAIQFGARTAKMESGRVKGTALIS